MRACCERALNEHGFSLIAGGHLLSFDARFDASRQSPDNLALGRIAISYKTETLPILMRVDLQSEPDPDAFTRLISDIQAAL